MRLDAPLLGGRSGVGGGGAGRGGWLLRQHGQGEGGHNGGGGETAWKLESHGVSPFTGVEQSTRWNGDSGDWGSVSAPHVSPTCLRDEAV